jgi:endoglucanase
MVFAHAYRLTNDSKYLNAIVQSMDYIFGKNATGYSFVTGYGCKTPKHIHHRPSASDKIDEPIPGFVVGGPNWAKQDKGSGVKYNDSLPAKSYMDVEGSYASNEVCINWNAPAVFVLGFLEANADKLK